ncbi:hypothetical protein C7974DRAFT_473147 [Boeremia exigua]|uniref:uncharacterized protein n=1 Tax=Boeremia exigua TaxID=749465 RepID=UPI001E8ED2ED|nr:uncharacterized protein C7974DRAFT_473147 [Boeremia exigua]KAH6625888.1 hypothetical protein C7974DRAFT_473147 [Boeremia exigua]
MAAEFTYFEVVHLISYQSIIMRTSQMQSLRRGLDRVEEEDLVDYDDSDNETQTQSSPIPRKYSLDIFSDEPAQELVTRNDEPLDKAAGPSTLTAAKTAQAAALISTLSNLLSDSIFRKSLGLSGSGDTVDFSFWASGFDFAVNLKLIGTAEVKDCKYGAECRNVKCTFGHNEVDRAAKLAGRKPKKLCSMINTPNSCSKGETCWFSHEAEGVACTHGNTRATCPKGTFCVYKHSDDEVVASIENHSVDIGQTGETGEVESLPQATIKVKEIEAPIQTPAHDRSRVLSTSHPNASTPRPHEAGSKRNFRSRDNTEDIEGGPRKRRRFQEHCDRQNRHIIRGSPRPGRLHSERPWNGRNDSGYPPRLIRGSGRGRKSG